MMGEVRVPGVGDVDTGGGGGGLLPSANWKQIINPNPRICLSVCVSVSPKDPMANALSNGY